MARSKVGKPTGETTKAGRPIYRTPEGENVSEKSVTFVRDGKYINAPSIWNGVRLNEDEVGKLYDAGAIKATSIHDTAKEAVAAAKERSKGLMKKPNYAQGGAMIDPVKAAQQQGLMARTAMLPVVPAAGIEGMGESSGQSQKSTPVRSATNVPDVVPTMPTAPGTQNKVKMPPGMAKGGMMADGGIMQEGGTVDPESGNEVPPGALQEEVRDDIPAQLSEGEFIFPADVVRFIGLEKLMQLRQAAKKGLAQMEAMGQMGNSEEATMDDDAEFESEIDDIISQVEAESNQKAA